MDAAKILDIVKKDGALFNARYYKDIDAIVGHINQHYKEDAPVTKEEVKAVVDPMAIHPATGVIMDAM